MVAKLSPTPAEAQVLLALLDGEAHGYVIMQRIAEQSEGRTKLGPGTLYTAIARLTDRGWLQESGSSEAGEDGRRRYYRLTSAGREVLQEEVRSWSRLASIGRRRFAARGA